MNTPENADSRDKGPDDKIDPTEMVPAAGKSAVRPSEVERSEVLHGDLRRTPGEEDAEETAPPKG